MTPIALTGAAIVTPGGVLTGRALLLQDGRIAAIAAPGELPPDTALHDLGGGWLLPGFIDTQVNGGGDVLFNDATSVAGIAAIAAAHRRFGTTGLLPTLISDHQPVIAAAIAAGEAALAAGVPGVLGVHVEGPHLNPLRKGIHDETRFIPLDDPALALLVYPAKGCRIVTLAPECVPDGAIRALTDAGVKVCAGHSAATFRETCAALDEGLAGFTHLFNAMTPLGSREPGMVGAALDSHNSHFGLIVDGAHVHPATMRIALAAHGSAGTMLVTDGMPPVGGTRMRFTLMGQEIAVVDGICRGADGTLAGSALSMVAALRNAMDLLGCDLVTASAMASGNPARFLNIDDRTGTIAPGLKADLVHLDGDRHVTGTWIAGQYEAAQETAQAATQEAAGP